MAYQGSTAPRLRPRRSIAGLVVAALLMGLGALGAPAAFAAPPITFTLSTVDIATGAPVSEISSGAEFRYSASVGCPDPSGCGPATLTINFPQHVEFVADAFHPPTGALVTSITGDPSTGTELVLSWDNLSSTAVAYLPAKTSAMLDASLNGAELTSSGELVAGEEGDQASASSEVIFTLRAYERPGLTGEAQSWDRTTVDEGSVAEEGLVHSTVTATPAANAPSTMTFVVPGPQGLPGATIAASEAFDLREVMLNRNPGGATVVFTLLDGTEETVTLEPGDLVAAAPEDAVGYTVTVRGLEPLSAQAEGDDWAVSVAATHQLRATQRTSGEPVIPANANSRQVQITAEITDAVTDGAPGEPAVVTLRTQASIAVNARLPEIEHKLSWKTESGEAVSVYGSEEPSTVQLRASNAGGAGLRQLGFTLPNLNSRYFDYQQLTDPPRVVFPAGATQATVIYKYGKDLTAGAEQSFVAGAPGAWVPLPGPEADAPVPDPGEAALHQVSGIEIVFTAPDGSVIAPNCAIDDPCAGQLELASTLRNTLLSTGAAIVPPSGGNGETTVGVIAEVVAVTTTGAKLTQDTTQATIRLVKPQLTVSLGKRFGEEDGTDQTVYPLTGVAHAGDIFDPDKDPQDFADHPLRFVASTKARDASTEEVGVSEFHITDPQPVPTSVGSLTGSPFNTIQVSALSADPAVCTTGDPENPVPVGSATTLHVWVVNSVSAPTAIERVEYTSTISPELIVGVDIRITPTSADGRFPVNVRCATAKGSTVKFRDTQLVGGKPVSPSSLGSDDTPGLLDVGNVAKLGTGPNGDTSTGADSLYLVDLVRATMYKDFVPGAVRSGVAGQRPQTSFLLSGVPATTESVSATLVDGGGANEAFDVFELLDARAARLGPDQQLSVQFRSHSGAAVGPKGTVAASTELEESGGATRELTPEEIADSQSAGYLAFQRVEREITWDRDWTDGEKATVGATEVTVTRADPTDKLQRFGAFSVILDMALRDTHALAPGTAVAGSNTGVEYLNIATVSSREASGAVVGEGRSSVGFGVFEATELYGNVEVSWREIDRNKPNNDPEYLVAQSQTPSRVVIDAQNRTALGATGVEPWDQWDKAGTVPVGMESLTVSVGGPRPDLGSENTACVADRDHNPFAINDFAGIHGLTWPTENAAVVKPGVEAPKIDAKLTYTFSSGDPQVIIAPVGTLGDALNPLPERWGDVIGVSVTWAEPGKYVGVFRSPGKTEGRLSFNMVLRDDLRSGFNYDFGDGSPKCLLDLPGETKVPIDGADQVEGATVDQKAWLTPQLAGTLADLPLIQGDGTPPPAYAEILLDVDKSSVVAAVTPPAPLYRDTGSRTEHTWKVMTKNTGNLDVTALRMATDSELLDSADWPDKDPAGYAPARGSAFDAFNVLRATLSYPTGASSAEVWFRDESGSWGQATVAGDSITLLTAGPGPSSWDQVTGARVQFMGDDGKLQRIKRLATGTLNLVTTLRTHLRSDPSELSPATALPEDGYWTSELTTAGVSYIGTFAVPRSEIDDANNIARIEPGMPRPVMKKYVRYDAAANTGITSTEANPGTWVNFTVVIENRSNATSSLYGFSAVDTLPPELAYNALNQASAWRVNTDYAPGVSTQPSFEVGLGTPTTLRWTWPEDQVLKPGERVIISVPLQIGDGVPAGENAVNTARVVGTGITGAMDPSLCAAEDAQAADCTATAYATTRRTDAVRAESYIDATPSGYTTIDRRGCDPTTIADWADGTWVRNPCVALTTAGGPLTYRLKLINSGNKDLSELRFVDELPKVGDKGTVLDSERGSGWTPTLVPGSVRLLQGTEATDLGARGDGAISDAGVRYSSTAKPCTLNDDASTSMNTLRCENSATSPWSTQASESSQALGADILFSEGAFLLGGEYVVVEFQMTTPPTGPTPVTSWNTAAITARTSPLSLWLPAAETPFSGARAQDASLTLSMDAIAGPATDWHYDTAPVSALLTCTVPGLDPADTVERTVEFGSFTADGGPDPVVVDGLPLGGECWVSDVQYDPEPNAAEGQYGSHAAGTTGFAVRTDPEERVKLSPNAQENLIAVSAEFAEAQVTLEVDVDGTAAAFLPEDTRFDVDLSCTFAGETRTYGTFELATGETETVGGLPVGAQCVATESDDRGATAVTATVQGEPAEISEAHEVSLSAITPETHAIRFLNTFLTGGDLTIHKTVEAPRADTAFGDVAFAVSCVLGEQPLELGDLATLGLSFPAGKQEASGTVQQLPAGAECTVHETESGGANVVAPDRTVTIAPEDEVIVSMVNTFNPAELALEKRLTGPGAEESRVPSTFGVQAVCTRELTIAGELQTVTDHSALTRVTPGTPVVLADLPEGSRCEVREPDTAGAESTTVESVTPGVTDELADQDAARVALRGPTAEGTAQPTEVLVTNQYAETPEDPDGTDGGAGGGTDGGGLSQTGGAAPIALLGVGLLLVLSAGVFLLRRRRGADSV